MLTRSDGSSSVDGATGAGEFVAGAGEGFLMADAGDQGQAAAASGQADYVAEGLA